MLKLDNLTVQFDKPLFINQSLKIKNNCVTLIVGQSGCGKTTLLYKLGLIDFHKNDGNYSIDNIYVNDLSEKEKALMRRYDISFVFQDYMLYDHFDIYDNLQYYATISGEQITEKEAKDLLHKVHLHISLDRMIYTLSSGQRQRLAIACSLIKKSKILILDEPTSALDEENAIDIFKILTELKKEKTIIMTSHNTLAKDYCDEIIEIDNGQIHKVKTIHTPDQQSQVHIHKSSLPFYTYINYIKKQFINKRTTKSLIMLANMMILIFCIGTSLITQSYMNESQSAISLKQSGWMYIPSIDENEIKQLDIDKYYPYYDISLTLYGESYPVIPYYDENDINDKIWTEFDLTQEKGFYLSHGLFYKYKTGLTPVKYIDFQNSENHQDIQLIYKGILLKGVKTEYVSTDQFIYMHDSLIKEKLNPDKINGYTLFCSSYENYIKQKDILENKGYKVVTYNEFDDIQSFIEQLDFIEQIIIYSITIIGIFILGYLYRTYIYERSKEFAILKSIGLTNANITTLTFLESLFMSIIGTLCLILLVIIFTDYKIYRICIYELVVLCFIYLMIRIMVTRLKPIQILRNE